MHTSSISPSMNGPKINEQHKSISPSVIFAPPNPTARPHLAITDAEWGHDTTLCAHAMALEEQHSTAQHSTAQHSTAQHSTAQHSTAQHSTAQHGHELPDGKEGRAGKEEGKKKERKKRKERKTERQLYAYYTRSPCSGAPPMALITYIYHETRPRWYL